MTSFWLIRLIYIKIHGATAKDKKSDNESSSAPNSDSLFRILERNHLMHHMQRPKVNISH